MKHRRTRLAAGAVVTGRWCPRCDAPLRVAVPVHAGTPGGALLATIEVCAGCGEGHIPAVPVVTISAPSRREARLRVWLRIQWWLHGREAARAGHPVTGCAVPECRRPGWWDCAWYESVDGGRVRWVFCGRRHRSQWLAAHIEGMTA